MEPNKASSKSRSKHFIRMLDLFNSKYNCSVCRVKLRYRADQIIHRELKHYNNNNNNEPQQQQPIRCPYCEAPHRTYFSLRTHLMLRHLDERPYACRLCTRRFHAFVHLKRHLKQQHLANETTIGLNWLDLFDYENSHLPPPPAPATSSNSSNSSVTTCSDSGNSNSSFSSSCHSASSKSNIETPMQPNAPATASGTNISNSSSSSSSSSKAASTKLFTVRVQLCTYACKQCSRVETSAGAYLLHIWRAHMNGGVGAAECWSCSKSQSSSCSSDDDQLIAHLSAAHELNAESSSSSSSSYSCALCRASFAHVSGAREHCLTAHCANDTSMDDVRFVFACVACDQIYLNHELIVDHFLQSNKCNTNANNNNDTCKYCGESGMNAACMRLHLDQHRSIKAAAAASTITNSPNNKRYSIEALIKTSHTPSPTSTQTQTQTVTAASKASPMQRAPPTMPAHTMSSSSKSRIDDIIAKLASKRSLACVEQPVQHQHQQQQQQQQQQMPLSLALAFPLLPLAPIFKQEKRDVLDTPTSSLKSEKKAVEQFVPFRPKLSATTEDSTPTPQPPTTLTTAAVTSISDTSNSSNSNSSSSGDKGTTKCEYCDFAFKTTADLFMHRVAHKSANVKRPYKCHLCSLNYSKPGQLLRHMIIHRAEKFDSVCRVCFSSFRREQDLKRHFLVHLR